MHARALIVEALPESDVVGFAQCAALDVSSFPHPSIPGLEKHPALWVARDVPRGPVSGFVLARRRAPAMEIGGIAVAPGHRRRGIGRRLLHAVADDARERGCGALELHVSTVNRGAIALYEALGFERMGYHRHFYRPGHYDRSGDAWWMRLAL